MKKLKKEIQERANQELEKFIIPVKDPVLLLLRGHLYSENLLERIILIKLKKGHKIVRDGRLTFNQKIILIDSFDMVESNTINALKQLNKIRNNLVHELTPVLEISDIDKLGNNFGEDYLMMQKKSNGCLLYTLSALVCYIVGALSPYTHLLEIQEKTKKPEKSGTLP